MTKNITRTIELHNYLISYVDMDTMQIKEVHIRIYDLIDRKNIEQAIKEELKTICINSTFLKSELVNKTKFKCSMPIDFYIEHSEHIEI